MQRFEAVCIASGPSLTQQDCEKVREWRKAKAGRRVFVVNTTYQIAPWADYLYANDRAWWNVYLDKVREGFNGELLCPLNIHGATRINKIVTNSGANALITAFLMGAEKIIMLGYDCKKSGDMVHWHGDHPAILGNGGSMNKWPAQFMKAAKYIKCEIVNASRDTDLDMLPRANLEDALK